MTKVQSPHSAISATCPTSDALQQYLAGWCDEFQSEQIELHLQDCAACESAFQEMDVKPDTLLQSLQSTVAPPITRSVSARDGAPA